ncbi:hypothetical protein RHSIM_Rhsim02G0137700 [Rhododendron simsii]|uniref:Seipin n=1 Tax=Rhododendron simsii TaxID=118357 RepID=A0A834HFR4_RHOSS|nr:hypothetical protein RHSIM_Rhsim02G0137700 [Rhododendron simsii]
MEHSQSSATTTNDSFFDALDDFPFYDCVDTIEPNLAPTSHPEAAAAAAASSLERKPSPEILHPSGILRRRSWSQHVRNAAAGNDSKNSNHNSTVSRDSTSRVERKYRVSRSLKENERAGERPDSIRSVDEKTKERPDSSRSVNEVTQENSTVTTVDDDRVDEPAGVESASGGANERSFTFLFVLAGLLIKAIAFQTSLLVNFVTFPIWLLYCGYAFVIDPFRAVRRAREYGMARVLRMWGIMGDTVTPFVYEWLKEHKSVWRMALRFGWGFLWASYVCVVLITLLVSAFVVSGFIVRHLVEEPIQRKETLTFDYTKNSPVAHVRLISCPGEPRGVTNTENIGSENVGAPRVIPPKHKLQVIVALTLPESDYNRNLGIFQCFYEYCLNENDKFISRLQVRVDFLSASGKALASLSKPCMLRFKSEPVRLLLTFLKVVPLLAGYSSESQTVNVKFRGFTEGDNPTACLKVMIEQRAEFRPGAGAPQIYDASLTLESELPLPKRIIWYWKKTVFIWIGMSTLTMELLFMLLFCRPIIMPRIRPRDGSANRSTLQNHHPAQR